LNGCGYCSNAAVKREKFARKISIGEMIRGEKVGSLSGFVEKYYVNKKCIEKLDSKPVEKSVDNVEKCELSTVFSVFSTDGFSA